MFKFFKDKKYEKLSDKLFDISQELIDYGYCDHIEFKKDYFYYGKNNKVVCNGGIVREPIKDMNYFKSPIKEEVK